MLTRFRFLLFFGALIVGSWPALLHADQPEQTPQEPASSSFLLVTRHGNAGPIGVIVNRPENIKLDKRLHGNVIIYRIG